MPNLLWLRLVFEVLTVPTTFVNETRYSFRLNVTVARLQDSDVSAQHLWFTVEGPFPSFLLSVYWHHLIPDTAYGTLQEARNMCHHELLNFWVFLCRLIWKGCWGNLKGRQFCIVLSASDHRKGDLHRLTTYLLQKFRRMLRCSSHGDSRF